MKKILQPLKNLIKRLLLSRAHKSYPNKELAPVFIIGTNRSGTSVVSSIISQHPNLEGLYIGNTSPKFEDGSKHTHGYCESYHVWSWLNDIKTEFHSQGENAGLWCHPQYISEIYRSTVKSKREALDLLNSIEKFRTSSEMPLIKDQLNLLRVGLIKSILPNAKFILVVRDFSDYLPSCHNKWFGDNCSHEHPSIGQHWMTGNQVSLLDLQTHFPNSHFVVSFNEFMNSKSDTESILKSLTLALSLKSYKFDTSIIDDKYKFKSAVNCDQSINLENNLINAVSKIEKDYFGDN